MSVYSILKHRADVSRRTVTYPQGSPEYVWTVVHADLRCCLSIDGYQASPIATDTTQSQQLGVFLAPPAADLEAGDSVKMTGRMAGTFKLSGNGRVISDMRGLPHHQEWSVEQIS